jgi:hypothetical protein
MDQKFALDPDGAILGGPSSGWLEVWDKPYNAVLTVYRSLDGRVYYLSTGWGPAYIFDAPSKILRSDCLQRYPLKLTELGNQLKELTGQRHDAIEAADPNAPRQWSYVEADDRGEIPAEPPRSRYYADVVYLGKFGVIQNARGSGRGEDVGFAPAGKAPEPRLGFSASCG